MCRPSLIAYCLETIMLRVALFLFPVSLECFQDSVCYYLNSLWMLVCWYFCALPRMTYGFFFSFLVRDFPYPFTTIIHFTCSKYNAHLINHHFSIWKSNHPFFIILGKLVKWMFSKTCCLFRALGSTPAFLYCCLLPLSSSCLQTVSVSFHWCSGWIVILPTLSSASLITHPSLGALPSQGGSMTSAEGLTPFCLWAAAWWVPWNKAGEALLSDGFSFQKAQQGCNQYSSLKNDKILLLL